VSFDDELQAAMRLGQFDLKQTRPEHIPSMSMIEDLEPSVVLINDGYWNGINNVNIEEEMVDLAANQLDFDTAAQFMHDEFVDLQTAIRGGR
jgi:flagellar basal-body rod protein FlgB